MQYKLELKDQNLRPHLDIEKDIQTQKNGLFTFVIRISSGNVVDYEVVEYVDGREYLQLKSVTFTELTFSHNPRK